MSAVRRIEVVGPARAVVAWERYADLSAWASWAPQIRGVEADGPRLALGRTGVVRAVGGVRFGFVVTAVDEHAMTWSWVARVGPVALTLHHDLAPEDGSLRAGLTLEGPAALVTAYAPPTRIALARLVAVS